MRRIRWEERFDELTSVSAWLRTKLREMNFTLVGDHTAVSPAVVTISLPQDVNSSRVGGLIQESGYLLSYNSEYLRKRNYI